MPRYFFNVRDGTEVIDDTGTELSGPDEARTQAVVASGEMIREYAGQFWDNKDWRMWVTDASGGTVCALRFSADDTPEQP